MTLREFFGDELGIEFYYRHPRSYARRGIFSIDEPSPTVRGVNRPIPNGYPGHDGDAAPVNTPGLRPLTTKERSRIQTFPARWDLVGAKSDLEQIIGNAVPVNLGAFIGNALTEFDGMRHHRARQEDLDVVDIFLQYEEPKAKDVIQVTLT